MSFFRRQNDTIYGDEVDGLTTISKNHLPYVEEPYREDPLYFKSLRSTYVNKINNWLDKTDKDYNRTRRIDERNLELIDKTDFEIKHVTIIKKMFDELNSIISRSGFEIDDNKQFKEDFIHLIYTVSKL
jgi:hypothetical protein